MQTIREINSNIFPMLYLFSGIYPKSFTILGSLHDFLFKLKHTSNFCINRKRKAKLLPRVAQEFGPQAGPPALGPCGRCARPRLHSGVADSGPPLSASPSSSGRPNRRRDRATRATIATRDSLVAFSSSRRTSGPPKPLLSPSRAPMATGTAGG